MDFKDTRYYENRELSWLSFNQRVLDEAMNPDNLLMEQIKFLSIVSSNLDEFFMVRVASIKEQVRVGYEKPDFAGMTPKQILKAIGNRTHEMVEMQSRYYKDVMLDHLKAEGIDILPMKVLNQEQYDFVTEYFKDIVYPVLTPLAVDASRPFPLILSKSLNIATRLKRDETFLFATVQVPAVLARFIKVPKEGLGHCFVMLEDLIIAHIESLFEGYEVLCAYAYRITRNADLTIDEEEAEDLLLEIEKSIKKRKRGTAIRLEVQHDMDETMMAYLYEVLGIHKRDVYMIQGPIDLNALMMLYKLKGFDHLKDQPFKPKVPKDLLGVTNMFEAIREKDIFLSHPFESFQPVVDLIRAAAEDEQVLAIKQTLYRVSGESPIVKALAAAAESGKQVTVLVELKARFDEENNIQWARRLEKAGCHVIYGLMGLKTHSKVTLIVRMEADGIRRYVHLGTGNYNDITAKLYTDMGLLTANEQIAGDISAVFNTLSGYSETPFLNKIVMAPTGLRTKFYDLIDQEIENKRAGYLAKVIIKMNALCDADMIAKIYQAAHAGVTIILMVRGICCLYPGIEGLSENITVLSIVGKYLEHNRIYYFHNRGEDLIYLSSADMMPRNLDRRVEIMFPIESELINKRVMNYLELCLSDNMKAKYKDQHGFYHKVDREGANPVNIQSILETQAMVDELEFFEKDEPELFHPARPFEA